MNRQLIVKNSIEIHASPEQVWEVLTNPKKIKNYLFGTETRTDWKPGSTIVFKGEYEGHPYEDKGNVLENNLNELLKYNYWSGFSGLEDSPENYSIITYQVDKVSDHLVILTWIQEGFSNEDGRNHSENVLPGILDQIKKLAKE